MDRPTAHVMRGTNVRREFRTEEQQWTLEHVV